MVTNTKCKCKKMLDEYAIFKMVHYYQLADATENIFENKIEIELEKKQIKITFESHFITVYYIENMNRTSKTFSYNDISNFDSFIHSVLSIT